MLGIMNNAAFDGGVADLYATPKRAGEKPVFDGVSKKPTVTYHKDGRKMLDGKLQEPSESDALWTALLKTSVTAKLLGSSIDNSQKTEEPKKGFTCSV